MKKIILAVILAYFFTTNSVGQTRDKFPSEERGYYEQLLYTFSKEGAKDYRPAVDIELQTGVLSSRILVLCGVKLDEYRTLGIKSGKAEYWFDANPAEAIAIPLYLYLRRYTYMDFIPKHMMSLYLDGFIGMDIITKASGMPNPDGLYPANKGDAWFNAGVEPGIRLGSNRFPEVFVGLSFSISSPIGFHFGIGF